jgi:hypothetical protein
MYRTLSVLIGAMKMEARWIRRYVNCGSYERALIRSCAGAQRKPVWAGRVIVGGA